MKTPITERPGPGTSTGIPDRVDRAAGLLVRTSLVIGGIAAGAMVLNVAADVALRSLFNQPISATNPLVAYWWMLPLVFFGLAAAQRFGEHTDLPVVHARLSDRGQALITLFARACTGLFVLLIGWFGTVNALEQFAVGEYDASTGVTIWPPRFAVPLACLAFALVVLAQMMRAARPLLGRDTPGSTAPQSAIDAEGTVR
jgi:TRAP-type C4-dicarboxylate transport system permease small subunit